MDAAGGMQCLTGRGDPRLLNRAELLVRVDELLTAEALHIAMMELQAARIECMEEALHRIAAPASPAQKCAHPHCGTPAPLAVNDWRTALGDPETLEGAELAYRELMRTAHPDAGGSNAAAAALNAAIAAARKEMRRG